MRHFVERYFWSLSVESLISDVGSLVYYFYSWLKEMERHSVWSCPGVVTMYLHCTGIQFSSVFCIVCLKVCTAINPGRLSWCIICCRRWEWSSVAGGEMPVSVVRVGEVPCDGTVVLGNHSSLQVLMAGGKVKATRLLLHPLEGLRGYTLMKASQKTWLAKDAGPFSWTWLVSMGNSRTPSQRPSGTPGVNLGGGSDLEEAVLYISIKGLSDKIVLEEGTDSHYFAAVNSIIN